MINKTLLMLLAAAGLSSLQAGTGVSTISSKESTPVQAKEESIFDKIWSLPQLYKNESNPILEELSLTGRYQGDYYNVESKRGDKSDWETRRFRVGAEAHLFEQHLIVVATIESDLDNDIFYNRFTDLYLKWHLSNEFNLTVGKQEPRFGYDREFSDRLHLTFERGFFDDQLYTRNDYAAGAKIDGKLGNWGYVAGIYSNDVNREFGDFNGGYSLTAEINYDFSKALEADKALLVFDYLHNETNSRSDTFTRFGDAWAVYFDYKKGPVGMVAQVIAGHGPDNVWGVTLMPTYDVTKKLQVVARYQLGLASSDNGISTLNHEQKTVGKFTGDTYNAGYIGLNYYIYGHKLKLMGGIEYANMGGGTGAAAGNSSWTSLLGVRMYF